MAAIIPFPLFLTQYASDFLKNHNSPLFISWHSVITFTTTKDLGYEEEPRGSGGIGHPRIGMVMA
jgi:hypothetical protein